MARRALLTGAGHITVVGRTVSSEVVAAACHFAATTEALERVLHAHVLHVGDGGAV